MAKPKPAQPVNAKTIDFKRPGAGLELIGATEENLWAKLAKLWAHRTEKKGGSKEVYESLVKNIGKSLKRSPNSVAAKQFSQFLKDGIAPTAPSAQLTKAAAVTLDYGIREAGRSQQHKPADFLSAIIDVVAEVALTVIGNAIVPGLGVILATVYGGVKAGVETGSVLGGVIGAAGAYGTANFTNGVIRAGTAAGGLATFVNSPAQFGSNLATNAVNSVKGAFSGIFTGAGGFVDPSQIGTAANLYQPASLGPAAAAGFGAVTAPTIALPGLANVATIAGAVLPRAVAAGGSSVATVIRGAGLLVGAAGAGAVAASVGAHKPVTTAIDTSKPFDPSLAATQAASLARKQQIQDDRQARRQSWLIMGRSRPGAGAPLPKTQAPKNLSPSAGKRSAAIVPLVTDTAGRVREPSRRPLTLSMAA